MPVYQQLPKKVGDGTSADPPPPAAMVHPHEQHALQEVHATAATLHETTLAHPVGPHPDHPDHHDKHAPKVDPKIQAMIDQVNAINAHLLEQAHEIQAKEEIKKQQQALKHQINAPAAIAVASACRGSRTR